MVFVLFVHFVSACGGTGMSLERKLRSAWHKGRTLIHVRGLAQMVAWVLAGFLFAFFADWLFDLPLLMRVPLTAAILVFVVWWLRREWWRRLVRFDPLRVAVDVEREYPQLNSLLISYVELSDDERPRASGSPELMAIVRDQADEAAGGLDFRTIVSFTVLRRLLAITLGVVLVFVTCGAVLTDHMVIAAKRLVGMDMPYPTKTRFGAIPGDILVRQGDTVSLVAEVGGQVPLIGTLLVRPLDDEDAAWQRFELDKQGEGSFVHELPHLATSLAYRFEIGDAESHRRDSFGKVEVVGPPKVEGVDIAITPPHYTGAETRSADDLSFEAPEGASVTMDLALSSPVAAATMVTEDGSEQPFELADGGSRATTQLLAKTSGSWFVRWEVEAGGRRFSFDGAPRRLSVVPDRAPVVTLRQPTGEVVATVNKLLEMQFEAKDDFGIQDMAVVYRVNDGEEFRLELPALAKPADQQHLAHPRFGVWPLSWRIRDELPYLKPGDDLVLQLEASDVHAATGEPRVGRSQELRVRVLSLLDYQQYVTEQFAEVQNRIAELKAKQKPIEVEVEALKGKVEE